MDNDVADLLAAILNKCETDPDSSLALLDMMIRENPGQSSDPMWKWARAMTFGGKGVFQVLRERQSTQAQMSEVSTWNKQEFIQNLGLSDEQLNSLEVALREIKEIEATDSDFIDSLGTPEEPIGRAKVDLMAIVLERCRPGKVQELLGTTKLEYFGPDHSRMGVRPGLELTSEDYAILWKPKFSAPSIVKAAIAMDHGRDGKGRRFVTCLLYQNCLDEWQPDDTLAAALSAGALYCFDDGKWHHGENTNKVFLGAVVPGASLPNEFQEPVTTDTKVHHPTKREIPIQEPDESKMEKEQPKKKGFLKRMLGG